MNIEVPEDLSGLPNGALNRLWERLAAAMEHLDAETRSRLDDDSSGRPPMPVGLRVVASDDIPEAVWYQHDDVSGRCLACGTAWPCTLASVRYESGPIVVTDEHSWFHPAPITLFEINALAEDMHAAGDGCLPDAHDASDHHLQAARRFERERAVPSTGVPAPSDAPSD